MNAVEQKREKRARDRVREAAQALVSGISRFIEALDEYELAVVNPEVAADTGEALWDLTDATKFLKRKDNNTTKRLAERGLIPGFPVPAVDGDRMEWRFVPSQLRAWALENAAKNVEAA